MGFFGIVTKFWGRTMKAKKLYNTHWVFSARIYEEAMNWILDSAKLMRPYGIEVAVCACYSDKMTGQRDEVQSREVIIAAAITLYADSLEEAQEMAYPFDKCPLTPLFHLPVTETNYEQLNKMQEDLLPSDQGLRFKCDTIYNAPEVSREEVVHLRIILIGISY